MASPPLEQMGAPSSQASRPKLKISLSQSKLPTNTQETPISSATPGGAKRKIVLKGPSQPQTPADGALPQIQVQPAAMTKAGRQTKPTKKKREHDEMGDDITVESPYPLAKKSKHLKILSVSQAGSQKDAKQIVIKHKGKAPPRPLGDGYDSEASDREEDPHIEEQVIFRMIPGEDLDFLRKTVAENGLDSGKSNPGFRIMWFEEETRRAAVTVRAQIYAAVLLDLPTITEGMKTWDKKNIMKSADISQMLYAFQKVASIEEAKKVPLPSAVEHPFRWPHGLTPPMHDCVHRRFAKVISRKEIEDKEAEVERLLRADRDAISTRFELIDDRMVRTPAAGAEDEDAEGEEEESIVDDSMMNLDLEADLKAAFEASTGSPATQQEGVTPITANATPGAVIRETVEGDEEEEEETSEEDSGDDDDDEEDLDEEEQARMDEKRGIRSMIADLKARLKVKEQELENPKIAQSMILRRRVEDTIRTLKAEIQLKMSSIGEEDEE